MKKMNVKKLIAVAMMVTVAASMTGCLSIASGVIKDNLGDDSGAGHVVINPSTTVPQTETEKDQDTENQSANGQEQNSENQNANGQEQNSENQNANGQEQNNAAGGNEQAPTEAPQQENTAGNVEQPITEAPDPEMEPNEYYNQNNNYVEANLVSVKPFNMWWEGDTLVAECFVVNGFDYPVWNISVDALEFANNEVYIAGAQFGVLYYEDGSAVGLNPGQYIIWTFSFPASCVSNPGANLRDLINCQYRTNYNY